MILVGPKTAKRIGSDFVLEPLGSQTFKNLEAVEVYRLMGEKTGCIFRVRGLCTCPRGSDIITELASAPASPARGGMWQRIMGAAAAVSGAGMGWQDPCQP